MTANDAYVDELLRAEEDIEVKSSNLGLLRNEFVLNLDTLQSQYYPKMAPVNAVVFVCREDQSLLELKISWQEKKLVMMEQRTRAGSAAQLRTSTGCRSSHDWRGDGPPRRGRPYLGVCEGDAQRNLLLLFLCVQGKNALQAATRASYHGRAEKYCSEPEMTPEAVLAVSPPCGAMSKWLRALRDLTRIEQVSAARRQTADEAREELRTLQENLQRKRDDAAVAEKRLGELLEERNAKIAELRGRYDNTMLPLQELFFDAHQNFNVLYRSPVRTRQYTQTEEEADTVA
ncbi:Hypothetical protein, putative [Bodo saltans]|uniref:Uncharacterized protein n=1 Tax=Bodo saltans TaxID=75058 RepID=A0A0S4KNI9_BODSA|nr:Hypothetical protein, putative [Bodo saltans]|eukprot:CUI14459.1 Hypothetical protein, putative [Bodo saltans]